MRKPVVHLYTVCWDEADMLGFFFRHYDSWVDRYVVYDDGSTDGSIDILNAHPKVVLRAFTRVEPESFGLSHKAMQDEAWKESRGQADWVVITAIDEHLHVRARPMAEYLAEQRAQGTTIIPALGFDMNHPTMPHDRGLLTEIVTRGRPRPAFNKLGIFNPDAVQETCFSAGRHEAEPVGDLQYPARDELMLWHYKHLGFERNAAREAAQALRLDPGEFTRGFAQHYLWSKEQLRSFWDEMEREATNLAAQGFEPDRACAGPLWWRARPAAQPQAAPKVSVLVKAYNHAPYVRQTIQSVLDQSFQDFEIVVTDDGSTDATPEILGSFTDPRIRLDVSPRNLGISAAMNATIARARGRYFAILNSDDWALPDRLQRQVAYLDTNPGVSAVFGLPRPVGEAGEPTAAFNDFKAPLGFAEFSRRNWLRRFFFDGNCLCAPTAMIRREVYEAVGGYDNRLNYLHDLDMWIRMLVAGCNIHVLPEELTAFRIRANSANMSASRPDSRLGSGYETTKILKRFAEFDIDLFQEVFAESIEDVLASDVPVAIRVAQLAWRNPNVVYQNFALGVFYETAATPEDFDRLRTVAGSIDALNILAIEARDHRIKELTRDLHRLRAQAPDRSRVPRAVFQRIARLAAWAKGNRPLDGHLDEVSHTKICGWARDPARDRPVRLRVFDNDVPIGEVIANRYRADLAEAGIGNGRHAFELIVPGGLSPSVHHTIRVQRLEDATELRQSPREIGVAPWNGHDSMLRGPNRERCVQVSEPERGFA